ncbi:GNAT family N-acetyltransferase [Actinomadura opuntiae]|uniref:GNAT family N-acetyltransferase n=1 Tax=Actinomadura sp. OS1-43 TaxID=604315 RepID=UPI00255AC46D|nr:GNAT family N-acetyltransferase [Actinomadura sp. OS1-43]MDL4816589.1 GNAT family N-acetyltransferase [Actinomadura sp. OS1-43]
MTGDDGDTRAIVLRTERLRVTVWTAGDADDLHRLHSDPAVMRQMTTGTQTRAQTRARIDTWIAEHAARGWSKWRVEDATGGFVGRAGFGQAHHTGHRELGYLLAPSRWGAGYATELVAALVRWHFSHPDAGLQSDLLAYVFPTNQASRRVLVKNHFTLLGPSPHAPDQLVYIRGANPLRRAAIDGVRASEP